jgi:predicted membrane protein
VLLSVLMMRWNVVIGGQEISKTGQGLLNYRMHIFGREGLLASAAVTVAPLALLAVLVRLLPPWADNATPSQVASR